MPQVYQKLYDPRSLSELVAWFKEHAEQLPPSLQLATGVKILDLPTTVDYYLQIVDLHKENPTFSAPILHLYRMRELLEAQGIR